MYSSNNRNYISLNGEYANREYRLRCFTSSITGETNTRESWEIGERNENGFPIHIKFDIERTDGTYGNTVQISLWNLSKATINAMLKNNAQLELRAGYGSNMPTIFTGTILLVQTLKDGGDMVTQITCTDNRKVEENFGVDYSYLRISFAGGAMCEAIIDEIATQTNMPCVKSNEAKKRLQAAILRSGYAFIGIARQSLDEVCNAANVSWTVQNGILYLTTSDDVTENVVHEINKNTGLINIPVRVYNTSVVAQITREENAQKGGSLASAALAGAQIAADEYTQAAQGYYYGYRIQYLLDGTIGINSIVHLTTEEATGYFRVYKLKISGDNYSGDWMCTAEIDAMNENSQAFAEAIQ